MWLLQNVSKFNIRVYQSLQVSPNEGMKYCIFEGPLSTFMFVLCSVVPHVSILLFTYSLLAMLSIIVKGKNFSFYMLFVLHHLLSFPHSSAQFSYTRSWAGLWVVSKTACPACAAHCSLSLLLKDGQGSAVYSIFSDFADVCPYISGRLVEKMCIMVD